MINPTSGLMALQSERRFTSVTLAVRLAFTHLKKRIIFSAEALCCVFGSVPIRSLCCVPAQEENNLASSKSWSLTFVGDGAAQRVQSAVKQSR